ncbi:hypothetical protein KPP03845_105658 [Streptomyces xanthophaeus]|nr:hypothetical protein KPP03845_105658 [Streptomyces xanthophaeus]
MGLPVRQEPDGQVLGQPGIDRQAAEQPVQPAHVRIRIRAHIRARIRAAIRVHDR